MPDERKRKVKIGVGGESRRHADGFESALNNGVPPIGPLHLDLTVVHEVVVGKKARRQVEDEGTEADDESEVISVVHLCHLLEDAS